ncbi:MAG: DNA polymerase III subunit delta [Nostocoides sp.]
MPARVPPLVLIQGPETLLADRATATLLEDLRVSAPDCEVVRIDALAYATGDLALHAAPSLFGGDRAIVVHDLDEAPDDLQADLLDFLGRGGEPGVTLIVRHKSGQRGKKVLDQLKANRARVVEAKALKSDRDKSEFAANEFTVARRKATAGAVRALVEAVGQNVPELAAACHQLVVDTTGVIDEQVVMRYYGGKVEATGFKVADAAVAGNAAEALRLLRHALAVGVDPVPIVAVLGQQLRQLLRVGSAGRGRSVDVARDLALAPWQVDKARRALSGWTGDALGRSIQAVAAADVAVKGGGRDPAYSVERAIVTIAREHQGG